MDERYEVLHLTCHVWRFNMMWHMCGLDVRATCGQRVTEVIKSSV